MNCRYYKTRVKYLDASKLIPSSTHNSQEIARPKLPLISNKNSSRPSSAILSAAGILSKKKIALKAHPSQDIGICQAIPNPETLQSCRLVRFPAGCENVFDFDELSPKSKSKKLIEPKILRCPYTQRRAFSANTKTRRPLEYTFGKDGLAFNS